MLGKSPIVTAMGGFCIPKANGDRYVMGALGRVWISKARKPGTGRPVALATGTGGSDGPSSRR